MTYLELTNIIETQLLASPFIERVENDDLAKFDKDKYTVYPMAAFYLANVDISERVNTYQFNLLIGDILDVNKETKEDNRDFIWNMAIEVINRLVSDFRRGTLSDTPFEIETPSLTPFTDRFNKGLAGMETTLNITVRNDMTIC